jgi:hypothetical protein
LEGRFDSASLLNDDVVFQEKYRRTRSSLWRIVDQRKDHRVFQTSSSKKKKKQHIAGTCGTSAPVALVLSWHKRNWHEWPERLLCVPRGQRDPARLQGSSRIVPAFLDYVSRKTLSNGLIQIEERRRNHLETERRADFGLLVPDCIGVVDGTLLPLAFRPSTHMTMMITKIETCGIVFTY